jgi:threonine dehydrogenase-like Zn-dependent dehydrogenase
MTVTVASTMAGAYIDAMGALELRDLPIPLAEDGAAVLRTVVSTVCGSDLHRFRGAESYGVDTDVFGHETIGVVVACPGGEFPLGERVLHVPFPADGRVFAPYQLARTAQLLPVPPELASDEAVFAQQLGTVVYALRRFLPDVASAPPASAYIAGAGPAGLLFVQMLKHLGCGLVHVSEPDPFRRALAESLGAILNEPAAPVDIAIDTSGELAGRAGCGRIVRSGGTVGLFGLPDDEPGALGIPLLDVLGRNMRIVGAMGAQAEPGLACFRDALSLIADSKIRVRELISHRGALADLPAMCSAATGVSGGVAKVLVEFPHAEDPSRAEQEEES